MASATGWVFAAIFAGFAIVNALGWKSAQEGWKEALAGWRRTEEIAEELLKRLEEAEDAQPHQF